MADLILGPLLRYVSDTEATVWVETDAPCRVEVLDHGARTWEVEGHHYALVSVGGLTPGASEPYAVRLDSRTVWPPPDATFPPSTIRTVARGAPLRLSFGSCRVSLPHTPPYTLTSDEDARGRGTDALLALTVRMRREPQETWPHALLLLGDQVYADEVSPEVREFIRARRPESSDGPPADGVADFEEYTWLYSEAWRTPAVRWLLSTVSTSMIFDDHDIHDDWNTSRNWVDRMRALDWWDERIVGAFMSYWIYQHLGNLAPRDLAEDDLYRRVTQAEGDAGPLLREFAYRADRETAGTRWSYCRDLGTARLVVMDSRAGRVLGPDRRTMVDEEEWAWVKAHATGGVDHLLLGTSLPFLLSPGMHYAEAWNEAVCAGAWGRQAAKLAEWLREAVDLEHWAAFQYSFHRLASLVRAVASGERDSPPASIIFLSGDVHHAYLARVAFRRQAAIESAVYQAVCSPVRNPLDAAERRLMRFGWRRATEVIGRGLARAARVPPPALRWRTTHGEPWFDNQIATLDIRGREATLSVEKTVPGEPASPELETVYERRLA